MAVLLCRYNTHTYYIIVNSHIYSTYMCYRGFIIILLSADIVDEVAAYVASPAANEAWGTEQLRADLEVGILSCILKL